MLHLIEVLPLQGKLELLVVPVNLLVLGALKERFSHQQDVENSPQREDVAGRLDMFGLSQTDYLRSHVTGCSTAEKEVLLEVHIGGQSEVYDDWLHGLSPSPQHDVFRL